MATQYLLVKLLHIFIAIVALGTSAGLGIALEFYGDHPTHGSFVLHVIERITALLVLLGYVLMLVTGLWLASLAWPFTARWIQVALALWAAGILSLGSSLAILRKRRRLLDSEGSASAAYRWVSFLSRALGGTFGLVVVLILYLIVYKPWS